MSSDNSTAEVAGPVLNPPAYVVDEDHKSGVIVIVAGVCMATLFVALIIRVFVRVVLNPPLASDDYLFFVTSIVCAIQASLYIAAADAGLGSVSNDMSESDINNIQRLTGAGTLFYILALYVSKICVALTYVRLTPKINHNRASYASMVLATLWVIPSFFIVAANCEFNTPWSDLLDTCTDYLLKWRFIIIFDAIVEGFLFALAIYLVYDLSMSFARKVAVVSTFSVRLAVIVFNVLRYTSLRDEVDAADPVRVRVPSTNYTLIATYVAAVACIIYAMRPFITSVSSNFGTAGGALDEESRYAKERSADAMFSAGIENRSKRFVRRMFSNNHATEPSLGVSLRSMFAASSSRRAEPLDPVAENSRSHGEGEEARNSSSGPDGEKMPIDSVHGPGGATGPAAAAAAAAQADQEGDGHLVLRPDREDGQSSAAVMRDHNPAASSLDRQMIISREIGFAVDSRGQPVQPQYAGEAENQSRTPPPSRGNAARQQQPYV